MAETQMFTSQAAFATAGSCREGKLWDQERITTLPLPFPPQLSPPPSPFYKSASSTAVPRTHRSPQSHNSQIQLSEINSQEVTGAAVQDTILTPRCSFTENSLISHQVLIDLALHSHTLHCTAFTYYNVSAK